MLELVPNILDNRRSCITAWSKEEMISLDGAIACGKLPAPIRQQDYHKNSLNSAVAGRSYYFLIKDLSKIHCWLDRSNLEYTVKDLKAEIEEDSQQVKAA